MRVKVLRMFLPVCLVCLGAWESTPAEKRGDAVAESQSQRRTGKKMPKKNEKQSPFSCNVSGLDSTQRQSWEKLIEHLASAKQEVRELPDGYAFRFAPEPAMVKDLAEFIVYERLCCPFFDFELAVEREGGPLWLRLKGRPGVKQFIRSEFGI